MKKAIIIWGAPSSGKGTQAALLSKRFGFFNFDTGDYIRRIIFETKGKPTKEILKFRKDYKEGEMINPHWVLKRTAEAVKKLSSLNESVIFSGSPRTLFEAFGDKDTDGLFRMLEREYGKKSILVFYIDIPEKESYKRSGMRLICTVCKSPLLASKTKHKSCPFCGAKLMKRSDDKPEIIKHRLNEYRELTEPIMNEVKKRGYVIHKIEGTEMPYQIHEKMAAQFLDKN